MRKNYLGALAGAILISGLATGCDLLNTPITDLKALATAELKKLGQDLINDALSSVQSELDLDVAGLLSGETSLALPVSSYRVQVMVNVDGKQVNVNAPGGANATIIKQGDKVTVTGPGGQAVVVEKKPGGEFGVKGPGGQEVLVNRKDDGTVHIKGPDNKEITVKAPQLKKGMDQLPKLKNDTAIKAVKDAVDKFIAKPKVQTRLTDLKNALVGNATRIAVPNDDGSLATEVKAQLKTKGGFDLKHEHIRVVDTNGAVIGESFKADKTFKKGFTSKIERDVDVADDGTRTETFKHTVTNKNNKTKTVEWTRTTKPDGTSEAVGKITRFDGSTVDINIVKTADGKVTTTTTDTGKKLKVEITKADEADTTAEAKVINTTDNTTVSEETVTNVDAAEPSDS